MLHPEVILWGLAGMGWFRESDPAASPTSVTLRIVRIDSSVVTRQSASVLLGVFQLINLMLDCLLLPVTAVFTLRLVSKVWQGDKQLCSDSAWSGREVNGTS